MTIPVVCALIINEDGRVLAACRSSAMDLPGKWEFPGGKVEPGETTQEALIREIAEELGIVINITGGLTAQIHRYKEKSIQLIPFVCSVSSGVVTLREHQSWNWFNHDELEQLDWAEADIPILKEYLLKVR